MLQSHMGHIKPKESMAKLGTVFPSVCLLADI